MLMQKKCLRNGADPRHDSLIMLGLNQKIQGCASFYHHKFLYLYVCLALWKFPSEFICLHNVLSLPIVYAFPTGRCGLIDLTGNSDALWYAQQIKELGIQFTGFCCANTASPVATKSPSIESVYLTYPYPYWILIMVDWISYFPKLYYLCFLCRSASGYDNSKSMSRGKASFASERYGNCISEFTGKLWQRKEH